MTLTSQQFEGKRPPTTIRSRKRWSQFCYEPFGCAEVFGKLWTRRDSPRAPHSTVWSATSVVNQYENHLKTNTNYILTPNSSRNSARVNVARMNSLSRFTFFADTFSRSCTCIMKSRMKTVFSSLAWPRAKISPLTWMATRLKSVSASSTLYAEWRKDDEGISRQEVVTYANSAQCWIHAAGKLECFAK